MRNLEESLSQEKKVKQQVPGTGKKGVFFMDIDFEFHKNKNSTDLLHNTVHRVSTFVHLKWLR